MFLAKLIFEKCCSSILFCNKTKITARQSSIRSNPDLSNICRKYQTLAIMIPFRIILLSTIQKMQQNNLKKQICWRFCFGEEQRTYGRAAKGSALMFRISCQSEKTLFTKHYTRQNSKVCTKNIHWCKKIFYCVFNFCRKKNITFKPCQDNSDAVENDQCRITSFNLNINQEKQSMPIITYLNGERFTCPYVLTF